MVNASMIVLMWTGDEDADGPVLAGTTPKSRGSYHQACPPPQLDMRGDLAQANGISAMMGVRPEGR
jgi:hypothetical protein